MLYVKVSITEHHVRIEGGGPGGNGERRTTENAEKDVFSFCKVHLNLHSSFWGSSSTALFPGSWIDNSRRCG